MGAILEEEQAHVTEHATRDLLRLATAGSVDDGKSTLIGRLLYDTKSVLADQLSAVEAATAARGGGQVDLALLTDGLRAEREQGITIDVAYRYFSTATRAFVLADTPGHVQYTRNMVTGASTAELAIVLVDARKGVLEQTRRHATITALLRRPARRARGEQDGPRRLRRAHVPRDRRRVHGLRRRARASPTSSRCRCRRSPATTWSTARPGRPGTTARRSSSTSRASRSAGTRRSRRSGSPCRWSSGRARPSTPTTAGTRAGSRPGVVSVGDEVTVLPSGKTSVVVGIDTFDGPLQEAHAPQSVTLRLADDVDVARGDVLVPTGSAVAVGSDLEGTVCWLAEKRSVLGARLLVRIGTRTVRALLREVNARLDVDTLTVDRVGRHRHAVRRRRHRHLLGHPAAGAVAQRDRPREDPAGRARRARRLRHAPPHGRLPAGRPRGRHHAGRRHDRRDAAGPAHADLVGRRRRHRLAGGRGDMTGRHPLLLDLAGRRVVVVGGGPVAARRTARLVEDGADVVVVAPAVCEDLVELLDRVTWRQRDYLATDLDGAWLVHTATGRPPGRRRGRGGRRGRAPVVRPGRRRHRVERLDAGGRTLGRRHRGGRCRR